MMNDGFWQVALLLCCFFLLGHGTSGAIISEVVYLQQ